MESLKGKLHAALYWRVPWGQLELKVTEQIFDGFAGVTFGYGLAAGPHLVYSQLSEDLGGRVMRRRKLKSLVPKIAPHYDQPIRREIEEQMLKQVSDEVLAKMYPGISGFVPLAVAGFNSLEGQLREDLGDE